MRNPKHILQLCTVLTTMLFALNARAQPRAAFSSDVIQGCSPLVVQFSDDSKGNPTEWLWDLGNGTKSTNQSPSAVYLNAGSGTVYYAIKLVVKNSEGADSVVKQKYIAVYSSPQVAFSSNAVQGCPPFNAQFTDKSKSGSGAVTTWLWDFGEGTVSTEKNPNYTYTLPNVYTVSLTAGNSAGCKQTFTAEAYIQVNDTVQADFDYTYTNICQSPAPVTFANHSTSATPVTTFKWNFGDGQTATSSTPAHTYANTGTYTVQLIAANGSGCKDTVTKSLTIGKVGADFLYTSSAACTNNEIAFTNNSSTVPTAVSWDFGDGSVATALSARHTYKESGTYSVTMTADFGSCLSTITKEVVVQNRPKVAFDVAETNVCQLPYAVKFTNRTEDAATYKWTFGDGTTSTETAPNHPYTIGGFFDVKLVATSANGCADSLTIKQAVRVGPPVIKSLGGSLPLSGCVPQFITPSPVIVSPEAIASYHWNFGDGTTSSEARPTHEYYVAGEYDMELIVVSTGGCSDTFLLKKAVTTVNPPVANFSADPLNVCAKTTVRFYDSSAGNVTNWWWQFGDGGTSTLQNPVHKYADTGYFKVTLVVTNSGCQDSVSKVDYVYIRPPVATFSYGMDCNEPYKRTFTDKSKGALSWQWDFGDGVTTREASPLHQYTSTGIYNVQLIVKNNECADTSKQIVRVVDEQPTFTHSMVGEATCRNDVVKFAASNFIGGNISGYQWDFGDNTPVSTAYNATISHKYDGAGSFSPQLIMTDVLGCKDTINSQVSIVVYGPNAGFRNVPGICINSSATFTDTSASDGIHPITKWEWNFGEGNTGSYTAAPFIHQYDSSGYFDVKLVVTDSYGCKDSVTKNKAIQVTNPIAEFSSLAPAKCVGNKVEFMNNAMGENLLYRWDFGDRTPTSEEKAPVHTYKNAGSYTVTLGIRDKFGCKAEIAKANFVSISNPKAAFNMNGPTEATCPPLVTNPINTSTNFTSVSWVFGDGGIANLENPTHVYTQGGKYELKMIVKGFGECYDTVVQTISLKGPSGSFSYDPLKSCKATEVTFKAKTKNATKVIWDYSDGNVDSGLDSVKKHTYQSYGQFIPKLVITDNDGCQVGIENPDTIRISGIQPAYLLSSQTSCDSSLAAFVNNSEAYWDKVKTYQWTFGDGKTSEVANPTHYYTKTGRYNTKLVVNTIFGCTDSLSQFIDVTVPISPVVQLSAPDSLCVGTTANLKAVDTTRAPSAKWHWSHIYNTSLGTTPNITYRFDRAGSYDVFASATTPFGCTDTASKTVNVIAAPKLRVVKDTFICKGGTVVLKAAGAEKFIWSSQSNVSCTRCANTLVNPDVMTQYMVTGINDFGCKATDTVTVQVIEPVKIAVLDDTLCVGEKVTLEVTGAQLYNWSPALYLSDPTSATPVFNASKDTLVTYTVTGTDEKKCFSDTKQVTVKVFPIPQIDIMNSQMDINVGSSLQIQMKSSADVTQWRWTPSTYLSDVTAEKPFAKPRQSITYTCVATNAGSCFARDQISINVMCNQANMFIPNTFSPNGDGVNERFYPRGKGVFNIKSLRIFNRWGQVVFERMNFLPNEEHNGWDGTFKGQQLPSDVYVYMLEITCDNHAVVPFKGNVTLLR